MPARAATGVVLLIAGSVVSISVFFVSGILSGLVHSHSSIAINSGVGSGMCPEIYSRADRSGGASQRGRGTIVLILRLEPGVGSI